MARTVDEPQLPQPKRKVLVLPAAAPLRMVFVPLPIGVLRLRRPFRCGGGSTDA